MILVVAALGFLAWLLTGLAVGLVLGPEIGDAADEQLLPYGEEDW